MMAIHPEFEEGAHCAEEGEGARRPSKNLNGDVAALREEMNSKERRPSKMGGDVISELRDSNDSRTGQRRGSKFVATEDFSDLMNEQKEKNRNLKQLMMAGMTSEEATELDLSECLKKNARDLKFSNALAKPVVIYVVIVLELLFLVFSLLVLFYWNLLSADFQGIAYLPPTSQVRIFVEQIAEFGGLTDRMLLWTPSSEVTDYHKESVRFAITDLIQTMVDDDASTPTGIPGVYSWVKELQVTQTGEFGEHGERGMGGYQVSQTNKKTHKGCKSCPLAVGENPDNLPIDVPMGTTAAGVAAMFENMEKKGYNSFITRGLTDKQLQADTGFDVKITYPYEDRKQTYTMSEKPWEISEITAENAMDPAFPALRLAAKSPRDVSENIANYASPAELFAMIGAAAATANVRISLRSTAKERFSWDSGASDKTKACPLEKPWYSSHKGAWEQDKKIFWDFVHAFYEDWSTPDWSCCVPQLPTGSGAAVHTKSGKYRNMPHVQYYGLSEAIRIAWDYDAKTGDVVGIKGSIHRVYIKYDLVCNKCRIEAFHRQAKYLEDAREKNPEVWGKGGMRTDWYGKLMHLPLPAEEWDSFLTARNFLNTERDDSMIHTLYDHLFKVSFGTMLACVLFLHPLYGLAIGFFLAMINFQVMCLIWIMGFTIDLTAMIVMAMAIGFEIEYVVHISHAFLHVGGEGFERTRNALEEMGITVLSAALSTAVQQLVLAVFAESLAYYIYPRIIAMVIVKAGITGFITVPGVLGICNQVLIDSGMIMGSNAKAIKAAA